MPDEPTRKTYLELCDPANGSHKFYEVTVEGTTVTVPFGRIGTNGQIKTDSYASAVDALQAAEKKIAEKLHKGYEAATAGMTEKLPVQTRVRLSVEEQLDNLCACGISLKTEIDRDIIYSIFDEEEYEREPYTLLLIALGGEAEEEPYGFISSDIWHFDTECIEDHGDYARIAMRMEELAGGTVPLEVIEDFVDVEAGKAWLALKLDGQDYRWEFKVDSDWVDSRIFDEFDALLRGRQTEKRFTYLDLGGGQDCLIGCSTPAQLENLVATTRLGFRWLCD
jgi:predicted DNA-binding WGR domain protein